MSDERLQGGDPVSPEARRVKRLSRKRQAFVDHYVQCWNATEAALKAGYSERSAKQQAFQLRQLPDVQEAIQKVIDERTAERDTVLVRLTEQGLNRFANYILPNGDFDLARCIADGNQHLVKGIKYDKFGNQIVEGYDAQRALELLGRHHKLFTDVVEHQGKVEVIGIDVVPPDDGDDE